MSVMSLFSSFSLPPLSSCFLFSLPFDSEIKSSSIYVFMLEGKRGKKRERERKGGKVREREGKEKVMLKEKKGR